MYFGDHVPPHFHVRYAEHRATMTIETLEIDEGPLPRRVRLLVTEWAIQHRDELRANWQRAVDGLPLNPILPLD